MRRTILAAGAALALLAGCSTPTSTSAEPSASDVVERVGAPTGTVTRVVDGDTLHVLLAGQDETVRMIGINAPETTKGKNDCKGAEATALLRELVDDQDVVVTADPTQANRDRYDRAIRYIDLQDGTDVQLQLIQAGLAKQIQYGAKYQRQQRYTESEHAAMVEGRGGWATVTAGGCGWTL